MVSELFWFVIVDKAKDFLVAILNRNKQSITEQMIESDRVKNIAKYKYSPEE